MYASHFYTSRSSGPLPPLTGVMSLVGRRPNYDVDQVFGPRPDNYAAAGATRLPPLVQPLGSRNSVATTSTALPPLTRTLGGYDSIAAAAVVLPPPARAQSGEERQVTAQESEAGCATLARAAPIGTPSRALLTAAPTHEEMLAIVAGLRALHDLQARAQTSARAKQKPRATKKVRAPPPTAGSMEDRGKQIPSAYSCIVKHEDDAVVTQLIAALRARGVLLPEETLAQGMKSVKHASTSDKADATTLVLYYAHVRRIVKVIGADGLPLLPTPWGYCEFLSRCVAQKVKCSHDTASRMRSALSWFWAYCGLDYSGHEGLMERNYRGYCSDTPQEAAIPRGAISLSQLDELTTYMKAVGHPEMVEPVEFQWAMALRGNQVGEVQFGQLLKLNAASHQGSLYGFTGPRDKVTQGHKSRLNCENHLCAPELNARLEQFIERRSREAQAEAARTGGSVDDMLVFPDWCMKTVNTAIKAAARKYKWSDLLNYCGTHCLRHGSLAHAFAQGGDEAAKRRGDQQSAEVRKIYTASHEQREECALRNGAKKKVVATAIRRRKGARRAVKEEKRGRPRKETSTKSNTKKASRS